MGTSQTDVETDVDAGANPGDPVHGPEGGIRNAIGDSALLKLAVAGVGVILFGAFLDSGLLVPTGQLWSIWSAVFAVWGAGLVVTGIGGYTFVWWRRRDQSLIESLR